MIEEAGPRTSLQNSAALGQYVTSTRVRYRLEGSLMLIITFFERVHWLNGAVMCVLDKKKKDWNIKGNGMEYFVCLYIEGGGAPYQPSLTSNCFLDGILSKKHNEFI